MSWIFHPVTLAASALFCTVIGIGIAAWPYRKVKQRSPGGDAEEEEDDEYELVRLGQDRIPVDELENQENVETMSDILFDIQFDEDEAPPPLLEFNARILRMADGDSGGHEDQSSNSVARQTGFFKRIGTISALSSRPEVMELSKLAESKNAKFRCIGCDTYELGQGLAGELGARVASELLVNHNVRLRVYGKDDYGRLLVVVVLDAEIKNGEMLQIDWSKFIVRAGLGIRYKGSKHEDNAWYDKILDPLQAEAVDEEMGVWGWPENERPIAPDEWRARNRSNSQKRRTSPTQENRPSRQDPSSHNSANPNRFCANR